MCLQHLCWFFYRYIYCGIWNSSKLSDRLRSFGVFTNNFLYENPFNLTAMPVGWCIFFLMAGISFTFSRNNYRRALITFVFFIILYLIAIICQTYLKYPVMLNFGIFLGYAFYIFFFQIVKATPFLFHALLAFLLLILTGLYFVFNLNFEINPLRWFGISQQLNLEYLDEWKLMPSVFFYFLGGILGRTLYKNKTSKLQSLNNCNIFKPILLIGKNSMFVYVLSIVVYPLIFIILTAIINGGW